MWPLTQAAQACFGRPEWPAEIPFPQASIEFEVTDAKAVASAARELVSLGYSLLHELERRHGAKLLRACSRLRTLSWGFPMRQHFTTNKCLTSLLHRT